MSVGLGERRYTAEEWASIVDEPLKDTAYLATRLGSAVADYLSWKRLEDGAAATTVDTYERILAQLCVKKLTRTIETLTVEDLREIRDLRPVKSRRLVTACYKDFCRWLYEEGRTPENIAGRLRSPKAERPPITGLFNDEEKAQIVAGQDTIRDRLCVLLLLRTGIRKGELRNLQVKDLDLVDRLILVRRGKGGKARRVPIRGSVIRAADEFLLTPIPRLNREPQLEDYLLYAATTTNRHGLPDPTRQLAPSTAHRWWYGCLQRAGIVEAGMTSGRKMHSTRHTYATDLGRATGWNMAAVSKNLGHSGIAITFDTYTQFAYEDQEQAVELLPEIEV